MMIVQVGFGLSMLLLLACGIVVACRACGHAGRSVGAGRIALDTVGAVILAVSDHVFGVSVAARRLLRHGILPSLICAKVFMPLTPCTHHATNHTATKTRISAAVNLDSVKPADIPELSSQQNRQLML